MPLKEPKTIPFFGLLTIVFFFLICLVTASYFGCSKHIENENKIFTKNTPENILKLKEYFLLGESYSFVKKSKKTNYFHHKAPNKILDREYKSISIACEAIHPDLKENKCKVKAGRLYGAKPFNKTDQDIQSELKYFTDLYKHEDNFLISMNPSNKTYTDYSIDIFQNHFDTIKISFTFEDKMFIIDINQSTIEASYLTL